jgi:hypothetical protein
METLLFALEACQLWWDVRIGARGAGAGGLAASGALIGLLAQGRATSVLLLVPAALLAVSPGPGPRPAGRPKALRLGALALGCALVCLPAALHNLAVAREWIPFTYNLGYNLYVGNHPGATGGFGVITGSHEWSRVAGPRADGGADSDGRAYLRAARGLELGPSASSRHWTREALAWISAHPGQAARLALRRVAMMWNRSEYPQVEDAQTFASLLGPLGLPFVGTFAFLGTLAIAGLAGAWRRGPPGRFVVGYAVVMTLAIAPFFVTDRYRHHLVPAAALLAAVALERLAAWLADPRARSRSAGLFAGLAVGLVVVFLPLPRLSDAKRAWGTASDLGMRYMEKGDAASAAREFERAAAIESRGLAAPRPGSDLAVERAMTYHNHALALEALQRDAEALEWRRRRQASPPTTPPSCGRWPTRSPTRTARPRRSRCTRVSRAWRTDAGPRSRAAAGWPRAAGAWRRPSACSAPPPRPIPASARRGAPGCGSPPSVATSAPRASASSAAAPQAGTARGSRRTRRW